MLFSAGLVSCVSLDIEPTGVLTGDQIYTNEFGVNTAIATLYAKIPIAAQNASVNSLRGDSGAPFSNWDNPSVVTGEAQVTPLRVGLAPKSLTGNMMSWWDYGEIRYANLVIQGISENAGSFTSMQETYNHWLGEAYFCRAWMYFWMVRSYGGVPIVSEPVSYQDVDNLYIPRNTEKEVIDFIISDLDKAISLMGPNELQTGRVNKYIAANMKARVALWAASIAKNSTVQLNGLVGIPKDDMEYYYKQAYSAACIAEDNGGKYYLYEKHGNATKEAKIQNFRDLFIDESADNHERMFVKQYDATLMNGARPENWSARQLPHGYTSQSNNYAELSVTTEWIEIFDDENGDPFTLDTGTPDSPVYYSNPTDLFADAQARLLATILVPGCQMPTSDNPADIYEVRKGIYESYPDGTLHTSSNYTDTYQGMTVQGKCGMGDPNGNGNGCIVWKYVDPNATGADWTGNVDWIEMRFAEVLLNKAEAAINIVGQEVDGKTVTKQDALEAVNKIRNRAGTSELADVDEDKIINERRCEFAFENQLFWDFKRWRMYENLIQAKTFHALCPYYVFDRQQYIFTKEERTELRMQFSSVAYYAGISTDYITRNPALLPNNPGY